MKIKKITFQMRRDFNAIYECEHCKATQECSGYDDDYFHSQVIPKMACNSCGKKSGDDYQPLAPRYAASEVV